MLLNKLFNKYKEVILKAKQKERIIKRKIADIEEKADAEAWKETEKQKIRLAKKEVILKAKQKENELKEKYNPKKPPNKKEPGIMGDLDFSGGIP